MLRSLAAQRLYQQHLSQSLVLAAVANSTETRLTIADSRLSYINISDLTAFELYLPRRHQRLESELLFADLWSECEGSA